MFVEPLKLLTCILKKCEKRDFPKKQWISQRSYKGSWSCRSRKPVIGGNFFPLSGLSLQTLLYWTNIYICLHFLFTFCVGSQFIFKCDFVLLVSFADIENTTSRLCNHISVCSISNSAAIGIRLDYHLTTYLIPLYKMKWWFWHKIILVC